jgi:hypothetical protein
MANYALESSFGPLASLPILPGSVKKKQKKSIKNAYF